MGDSLWGRKELSLPSNLCVSVVPIVSILILLNFWWFYVMLV